MAQGFDKLARARLLFCRGDGFPTGRTESEIRPPSRPGRIWCIQLKAEGLSLCGTRIEGRRCAGLWVIPPLDRPKASGGLCARLRFVTS
jgi:hypothetical protein